MPTRIPYVFGSRRTDRTSTLESIVALGMAASSFSAIGDRQGRERGSWQAESMHGVRLQLDVVRDLATAGKVRLIRRAVEITIPAPGTPPGAILALEGAHPIGEDPDKVDTLHAQGVRVITVMHYAMSDLGDCMTCRSYHKGLSPAGEGRGSGCSGRASWWTLRTPIPGPCRQTVDVLIGPWWIPTSVSARRQTTAPVGACGPGETWSTLRKRAESSAPGACLRAAECQAGNLPRLGPGAPGDEAAAGRGPRGIGTDGGGGLPSLIQGYRDVRDLAILARASREVGSLPTEIAAIFGGNLRRVFEQAVG